MATTILGRVSYRMLRGCCLCLLTLGVCFGSSCQERTALEKDLAPSLHPDGQRWRVVCIQGGDYIDYAQNMRGLLYGLQNLGWVGPLDLPTPARPENLKPLWDYLAQNDLSPYLTFLPDGFYSAEWEDTKRAEIRADLIKRLRSGDVDFVIALGTWSGQDMATDEHNIPVMVISASDAIAAGIIKSLDNPGLPHLHARCDPDRYERQIRTFHSLVNFKKLGVVFEDTPEGLVWSNMPELRKLAPELGYQLIERRVLGTNKTDEESRDQVVAAWREMAPQVDAVWLSTVRGEGARFMPESLKPLFGHNVATWSQTGPLQVRRGVLFGMATGDMRKLGLWSAKIMARILNGATPAELPMRYVAQKKLVINAETARRIGYDIPPGLMEATDQVFQEIETRELKDDRI